MVTGVTNQYSTREMLYEVNDPFLELLLLSYNIFISNLMITTGTFRDLLQETHLSSFYIVHQTLAFGNISREVYLVF